MASAQLVPGWSWQLSSGDGTQYKAGGRMKHQEAPEEQLLGSPSSCPTVSSQSQELTKGIPE